MLSTTIRTFARRFLWADTLPMSKAERWRAAWGALLGLAISGLLTHAMPVSHHWLIAPVGASAVILYGLSHSPLAQPWAVIGSYLFSTLTALASSTWIPNPQLAAAVAVAASIWLMARLNCMHPPGGSLALMLVLDAPYDQTKITLTVELVLLNLVVMLLAAVLVNNLVLRRRYPFSMRSAEQSLHATKDVKPTQRIGLSHADLKNAVQRLDTFIDVQEEELVQLYNLAVDHAFTRHTGLTCGDIMSRDVVRVHFETDLEAAWNQLRAHKIKALPVVDSFSRLIGILTVADFLRQMDDTTSAGLAVRLQGLLKRTPGPNSGKAEVVGQIMTEKVFSARTEMPIAELVYQLSDKGLHHIPVVDDKQRILGMVTQSDIIVALYKHIALSRA